MTKFTEFVNDDAGAVTIDWLTLSAGILLLGLLVVYSIFNSSINPMVSTYNSSLSGGSTNVVLGEITLP
jgi:hypothetical protein